MGPFPIETSLGKPIAYGIYLLIGFGFGFVLEMAGFGNSRKLAAQFYLGEHTVLKVMFTAIIVAMVLIFGSSAIGILDYDALWVNPTYLWPGIVGGLIMGVGFIVGGFCPGTSIVALATLKIDGVFFVLGVLTGILLFGETVGLYEAFWHSSFMGRLTVPEVFNLSTGAVVVLVVLMALFMFWGAEQLERIIGGKDLRQAPRLRYAGAAALVATAMVVAIIGQPSVQDKWEQVAAVQQPRLDERKVQIHPGELLDLIQNDRQNLILLDVRDEADYNVFHLTDARRVPLQDLAPATKALKAEPSGTVYVVMSNTEGIATEAWKTLVAQKVPNAYILEGGINNWLEVFGHESGMQESAQAPDRDVLRFAFESARGSAHAASRPQHTSAELGVTYQSKVEVKAKTARKGGCG